MSAANNSDTPSNRTMLRTELRNEALQARSEMPQPYRAHKSAHICQSLLESLDLTLGITGVAPEDTCVAVYSSFPEEVCLHDFIEQLYQRGIRVAFPCMIKDSWSCNDIAQNMEMRLVDVDSYREQHVSFLLHPLTSYFHDSEELAAFPYIPAVDLTMIVVPVVAFDTNNNRLGYGGGNYDRYLTQLSSECRKIGVAFTEQHVDPIPAEQHDIPLPILSV